MALLGLHAQVLAVRCLQGGFCEETMCQKHVVSHDQSRGPTSQPGGWYLWKSSLTKCQSVAQQSVKAASEEQPCRYHRQRQEEEVLQAAEPAAPEMPHTEADTNLQPTKDPMSKQLEMP